MSNKKFKLIIFGATTNIGKIFIKKYSQEFNIIKVTREIRKDFINFDLNNLRKFDFPKENFGIISFAPIWLFSNFIEHSSNINSEEFNKMNFIISLSSTSVLTKRFSPNVYDINLSKLLIESENKLFKSLSDKPIKNLIIRPTIIYGDLEKNNDKNLSTIINMMRKLPLILLPKKSGLRQPIHYSQLSEVSFYFIKKFLYSNENLKNFNEIINLGGDEELSYELMVKRILDCLESNDKAKKCRILKVSNRIYNFLLSPLILFKPNLFFAFQRICANLSGFKKVGEILSINPQNFPLR